MPDTEKMLKMFETSNTAAEGRFQKLQETAHKRHVEQIKETGEINGNIKALTGTVGKLDTSITKLQDEQKTHGERIVAVEGKADAAREIADTANDKAQALIETGALSAEADAESISRIRELTVRHGKGVVIGGAGVGALGTFLLIVYAGLKAYLADKGVDLP